MNYDLENSDVESAWVAYKKNSEDDNAVRVLVLHYFSLIQNVISALPKGVLQCTSREELQSMGTLGLYRAIERYTPGEVSFRLFAPQYIRYAILGDLREQDILSRGERARYKKVMIAFHDYENEHGTSPDIVTLSQALDMSEEEVSQILESYPRMFSFDDPNFTLFLEAENLLNGEDSPDAVTHEKLVREKMSLAIRQLSPTEQYIINARCDGIAVKQIAETLHLSSGRISQCYLEAVEKLKRILNPPYSE